MLRPRRQSFHATRKKITQCLKDQDESSSNPDDSDSDANSVASSSVFFEPETQRHYPLKRLNHTKLPTLKWPPQKNRKTVYSISRKNRFVSVNQQSLHDVTQQQEQTSTVEPEHQTISDREMHPLRQTQPSPKQQIKRPNNEREPESEPQQRKQQSKRRNSVCSMQSSSSSISPTLTDAVPRKIMTRRQTTMFENNRLSAPTKSPPRLAIVAAPRKKRKHRILTEDDFESATLQEQTLNGSAPPQRITTKRVSVSLQRLDLSEIYILCQKLSLKFSSEPTRNETIPNGVSRSMAPLDSAIPTKKIQSSEQ